MDKVNTLNKYYMAAGRPIEYNENYIIKAQEYLDTCVDEEYTRIKTEGDKSTSYDNLIKVRLPTIEGLGLYLDIARATVYDWQSKYPAFSDIIDKLQEMQAERLVNNGMAGTYNPTIAKVLLSKHGYRDSQEITGKDGSSLFTPSEEEKNKIDKALGIL